MDTPYSLVRAAQAMSTLASDAMQWEQIWSHLLPVLRAGHGKTSSSLVTQTECPLVTGAQSAVLQECTGQLIFIQKESSLPALETTAQCKSKTGKSDTRKKLTQKQTPDPNCDANVAATINVELF